MGFPQGTKKKMLLWWNIITCHHRKF